MAEQWIAAGRASQIPPGAAREIEVQGRVIAVFNVNGTFYAIDGTCPHRGGPLGEGTLDGTIVTCPWHAWQFDVTTGRCQHNPSRVQTFEVKVEDDQVLVRVE